VFGNSNWYFGVYSERDWNAQAARDCDKWAAIAVASARIATIRPAPGIVGRRRTEGGRRVSASIHHKACPLRNKVGWRVARHVSSNSARARRPRRSILCRTLGKGNNRGSKRTHPIRGRPGVGRAEGTGIVQSAFPAPAPRQGAHDLMSGGRID